MAKKKIYPVVFLIIIVLLIVVGLVFFPRMQSILTPPVKTNLVDGRVYWVATVSGDSLDEGFNFEYRVGDNVNDFTLPSGVVVEPKKSYNLRFEKGKSQCVYVLEKTKLSKLLLPSIDYYILKNPERVVEVVVRDNRGNIKIIDGSVVQSVDLIDSDGRGIVTIQTVGIIGSKLDCPDYENVALMIDNNFVPHYFDRLNLVSKYNSLTIYNLVGAIDFLVNYGKVNTQFVSAFTNLNLDSSYTKIVGDINVGNAVFTVTADQDVFDSVLVQPASVAIPRIESVNINDLERDTIGTLKVVIINTGNPGNINVKLVGGRSSFSPSSINVLLNDRLELSFNVKSGFSQGSDSVSVEVCGVSQFGGGICDSEVKNFNILNTAPKKYCGDNICDSLFGENANTCNIDCKNIPLLPDEMVCAPKFAGLVQGEVGVKEECGFLCNLGITRPTPVNVCVYDYSLFWIFGLVILAVAGIIVGLNLKRRRKKFKINWKVVMWLLIVVALIILWVLYYAYIIVLLVITAVLAVIFLVLKNKKIL